jgi:hypothetical protein
VASCDSSAVAVVGVREPSSLQRNAPVRDAQHENGIMRHEIALMENEHRRLREENIECKQARPACPARRLVVARHALQPYDTD